jgi:DNA-binding LacI/PurR family transcriptional regulator
MAVTLRDIAERTGVSPSVVSTVLSGRENGTFVSKDTKRRVLEVAQQLNYVPVRTGRPRGSRRLRRLHTEQFIGVWSPSADRSSHSMVAALQEALIELSDTYPVDDDGESDTDTLGLRLIAEAELPRLDSLGLFGLIVVGDVPLPRAAAAASIPCVQLGEPDTAGREIVAVHLDSFAAGQSIGNYLWSLGHQTLAFVAPASKPRATRNRWQGLQSVWVERGAPHTACVPAPYDTDRATTVREQIEHAVRKVKSGQPSAGPSPTSIVCFDETVAAYTLQALSKLGLRVPGDVSVVAFGDSEGGAEAMAPPVTSIRFPVQQMVRTALQAIYSIGEMPINGVVPTENRHEIKCTGQLVVRESCVAPPEA